MSLEQKIELLTATIAELTAVTKDMIALRGEAIETIKASAKTETAPKATTTKATAAKAEAAKTETAPAAPAADPAADAAIHEELKGLVAQYIGGTDREEERAARKAKVKALLNHAQIKKADVPDASSTSHIKEESLELFKKNITGLIAKGDLTEPAPVEESLV